MQSYWFYKKSPTIIKKIYISIIKKFTKGEFYSVPLRNLFKSVYGIDIGIGSYGCFDINFAPKIKIGRYCSFAKNVSIVPRREHPLSYASTHPFFFNSALGYVKEDTIEFNDLEIGNDVWIGQNAIICSKCKKIGNGSVIAAGAVVTSDVPSYAVVAGVPAKIVKERFDIQIQNELEKSQWYDLEPKELKNFAKYIQNPTLFCREINQYRRIDNE